MPHPYNTGIRDEVPALAHEGMWQSVITGDVGLTHASVNGILRRHASTGTLLPGNFTWAPRKTTPCQDHALLRMVQQDRFISAPVLTAWMRNLCGMRDDRKTINNRPLSRGYRVYRPTEKPLLTCTSHRRLCLGCAQGWQNLTMAHWQHVNFGDEPRFKLYPVDDRLRVRRLHGEPFQQRCQAYRFQAGSGSVHV